MTTSGFVGFDVVDVVAGKNFLLEVSCAYQFLLHLDLVLVIDYARKK